MKTIKCIFLIALLSGAIISCSKEEILEDSIIRATGDEPDEHVDPDEEVIKINKEIVVVIEVL